MGASRWVAGGKRAVPVHLRAIPIGAEILGRSDTDEAAADPAAAALRQHLAKDGADIDVLPDRGWTLAGMDADGAEFVTVGGDLGMKLVALEPVMLGSGW